MLEKGEWVMPIFKDFEVESKAIIDIANLRARAKARIQRGLTTPSIVAHVVMTLVLNS